MVIRKPVSILAVVVLVAWNCVAAPPDRDFTFQGVLTDGASPADGLYDLRFRLFDAASGGAELTRVELDDERVSNGRLTAVLDLGDPFDGRALWLQIEVRPGASTSAFTALTPRQPLTGAPHALAAGRAGHAATASTAVSAGDTDTLDGQHGSTYLAWSSLTGVPGGLADGDDDVLGTLACSAGEVATWSGSAWICDGDDGVVMTRTTVVHGTDDPVANGAALLAAMSALPAAASQQDARRVLLEPGVFDLGDQVLAVGPWVVLEGSGREVTVITSSACSETAFPAPTVALDSDAEVKDLTVVDGCVSPTGKGCAVELYGDRGRLTRVTARDVTGADRCMGVWIWGNSSVLDRVIAEADGGATWTSGIEIIGDGTLLLDCAASATGGGYNNALLVGGWTRVMGGSYTADHAAGTNDSAIEIAAAAELYDVTVTSEGDAVYCTAIDSMTVTMSRADIHGTVDTHASAGESLGLIIEHSSVDAAGTTIAGSTGVAVVLGATRLAGDAVQPGGGVVACAGVWDETWAFFPNTCP